MAQEIPTIPGLTADQLLDEFAKRMPVQDRDLIEETRARLNGTYKTPMEKAIAWSRRMLAELTRADKF